MEDRQRKKKQAIKGTPQNKIGQKRSKPFDKPDNSFKFFFLAFLSLSHN